MAIARVTIAVASTINMMRFVKARYRGSSLRTDPISAREISALPKAPGRDEVSDIGSYEYTPMTRKGRKARAVSTNVTPIRVMVKGHPSVRIGSGVSRRSFVANDPAMAIMKTTGRYRPTTITMAVEMFQNGVFAKVPR